MLMDLIHPTVQLQHKNKQTGEIEHHKFTDEDDFKADTIKTFIRQKTGIYLPLPGCIEEFDNFAIRLLTAENAGEKGKVMSEAEKAFLAIPSESTNIAKADIYVKIMRKTVKEGNAFPGNEMKRVKNIIKDGKIADAKKESMEKTVTNNTTVAIVWYQLWNFLLYLLFITNSLKKTYLNLLL